MSKRTSDDQPTAEAVTADVHMRTPPDTTSSARREGRRYARFWLHRDRLQSYADMSDGQIASEVTAEYNTMSGGQLGLGYRRLFRKGVRDVLDEIAEVIRPLDGNRSVDPLAKD